MDTLNVAISGISGSGKSNLSGRLLTTALPNAVLIGGDKHKYETIGEIFADRPLIKRQWRDHELLGDDGRENSMVLAADVDAYKALMDVVDPIVAQKMLAEIEQAKANGKQFCIMEYYAMKRLAPALNQADIFIEVMAKCDQTRFQKLLQRHNAAEEVENIQDPVKRELYAHLLKQHGLETVKQLYDQRDQAFSMTDLDWQRWRNHVERNVNLRVHNQYCEQEFDQWAEHLGWIIKKYGQIKMTNKDAFKLEEWRKFQDRENA